MITKEWQLVEAQRDGSHEFKSEIVSDLVCTACGKPRWAHVFDGFKPSNAPSGLSTDPGLYRGPHPGWTRPGSFSAMERQEMIKEERAKRAEIERAIAEDRAKFKARSRV